MGHECYCTVSRARGSCIRAMLCCVLEKRVPGDTLAAASLVFALIFALMDLLPGLEAQVSSASSASSAMPSRLELDSL